MSNSQGKPFLKSVAIIYEQSAHYFSIRRIETRSSLFLILVALFSFMQTLCNIEWNESKYVQPTLEFKYFYIYT